jgi:hypothetical protein
MHTNHTFHSIISTVLHRDIPALLTGDITVSRTIRKVSSRPLGVLVKDAIEAHADALGLSLVSTRDGRYYVNGEELLLLTLCSSCAPSAHDGCYYINGEEPLILTLVVNYPARKTQFKLTKQL